MWVIVIGARHDRSSWPIVDGQWQLCVWMGTGEIKKPGSGFWIQKKAFLRDSETGVCIKSRKWIFGTCLAGDYIERFFFAFKNANQNQYITTTFYVSKIKWLVFAHSTICSGCEATCRARLLRLGISCKWIRCWKWTKCWAKFWAPLSVPLGTYVWTIENLWRII